MRGEGWGRYSLPLLALAGSVCTSFHGHANCRNLILIYSDFSRVKTLDQTEKQCKKMARTLIQKLF